MKHKLLTLVLAVAVIVSMVVVGCAKPAPAPAPAKEPIEFKFAHEMPAGCAQNQLTWVPWTEDIEKATNGRVKVTIYPGRALGPTDQYVEGVTSGMIDIAWIPLEFFEGCWPLSMIGYYPIGVKTAGTLALASWDLYKEFPEIQAEFPGMKVLALYGGSPKQIYTSEKYKNDIRTLSDVNGMKIKVGGGPFNDACLAVKGVPVTMPAPDMYEALQKGTIDGSWFELGDGVSFLLQDVCRSVTVINAPGCAFAMIMNTDSFAKMTPEDQKIFDSLCGDSYIERVAKVYYINDAEAEEILTKAGVEVIYPTPAEYQAFQDALSTIVDKWLTETNALGKPADAVLERAKELTKEWEQKEWWK